MSARGDVSPTSTTVQEINPNDQEKEEKPYVAASNWSRFFSIPEYPLKRGGQLLSGKTLNWGITLIANVG